MSIRYDFKRKDGRMMKSGWKILLLTICSAILLTACNGEKTELEKEIVESAKSTERTEATSKADVTEQVEATSETKLNKPNVSTPSAEVDYEWYQERFYRDTVKSSHWINFHNTDKGLYVTIPGYSFPVDRPKIMDDQEYGTILRYTYKEEYGRFDFYIDYIPSRDEIIVLYTNYTYQSANAVDYSGVYVYDENLSNAMCNKTNKQSTNVTADLTNGQCFECFETKSGEDITLTVHLFYSDDSDTPSSYKGELSNGVEFWFKSYKSSSESITYKIDCTDGTNAYLKYDTNASEIILSADKATDYGNMYGYSGTYIELPDEVEE